MTVGNKMACSAAIISVAIAFFAELWQVGRVVVAFGLILLAGRNAIDRPRAVRSGYSQIPQARQIDTLIGTANHSVMNEGDETEQGVKEEWISEVYFRGRYELIMTVDIRVDRKTSKVTKVGTPIFRLLEIESVEMSSDGRAAVRYRPSAYREFGAAEWERVVEAKGDFSVIGVHIAESSPILNFDEFVRETRWRARLNAR